MRARQQVVRPQIASPAGPTLITGGNSMTATGGYVTTTGQAPNQDDNWFNWARGFIGPRFIWQRNVAIAGETTRQQINRLAAEVFPYAPKYFQFMEGTNSIAAYIAGGSTTDQAITSTIADFEDLISRVLNQGIRLILCTIPPRNDVDFARNCAHEKVNQYLRHRASTSHGVILVDIWAAMVDPTSATANTKANFLKASDNLHMSPKGARAAGTAWLNAMNSILPTNLLYVSANNSFHRGLTAYSKRMNSNALFTGSGGSAIGTGVSGTIAAACRAGVTTGTVTSSVCSLVARADGFGNNQRLVASGGAANAANFIGTSTTEANSYYNAGDYLMGLAHVSVSGATNLKGINIYGTYQINGTTTQVSYGFNNMAASVAEYDQTDFSMWLYTPISQFSAGTVTINALGVRADYIASSGAVTLDVGRMENINLGPNITMY